MLSVAAQVAVYPLRQRQLSPAIDEVLEVFHRHGLQIQLGPMSTLLAGESSAVFAALHEAFRKAAERGAVVMTVTFSNACPTFSKKDSPS